MDPITQYSVRQEPSRKGLGAFLKNTVGSLWNKLTGAGMTSAQQQQQDYETEMSNTAFQRQVSDMQKAGLNPALLYGNGAGSGASTPTGADVSGNGADLGSLISLMLAGRQANLLDAQADQARANANKANNDANLTGKQVEWFDRLSEAQLGQISQAIATGKADEALKRAGVGREEAQRELAANQAILAAIDADSRDRLNALQGSLMAAQAAKDTKEISKIDAEINELYQRCIVEAAQAGLFDQQSRNLLVQEGILHYDEQSKKFEVDHQKGDRNWRIAGQIIQGVTGLAISGSALGRTISTAGKAAGAAQAVGSSLWTPSSAQAFGTQYHIGN